MTDDAEEVERLRGFLDQAKQEAKRDRVTIEALRNDAREAQGEALRHVRNTLAVVHSIVGRIVGDEETAEDYQARLSSRLTSFARLQSHLLRNPTTGVNLSLLIADELLPFGIRLGAEAHVEGGDIRLKPKAASVLGGAFHELARMAVEGSSFAGGDSRIVVRCVVETEGTAAPYLRIDWNENGRRKGLSPNAKTEFDRDVEGVVAYELAGTVLLEMASGGLNCQFRLPATQVISSWGA